MSSGPSAADRAMGWPRLVRDVTGLKVRLARDAANAQLALPKGTTGVLTRSFAWHRLEFTADPCTCCGAKGRISRMSWRDFEVVGW